jgi:hypothetical protein
MEAATPLRKPHVKTVGDRLAVDGLVVDDEAAVRLAREREEAGEDPARMVVDAIEIGARVLDREQAGANAEFVKTEFGKVSKEVEHAFGERARVVGEQLEEQLEAFLGPESGHLAKALERHFSDGSSVAVQNQVKEIVGELMQRAREDLLRQFSSADGKNPLADFKLGATKAIEQAAARQDATARALLMKIGELGKQVQGLRDEKDKLEELEAEREKGTAKGRSFEERVFDAVDELASAQGDCAEAVGDLKGATGRTGDVLVSIEAASGPARGRIVFEAKDQRLSRPKARQELDRAMDQRDADFAVLVVPSEEELPARMQELREYDGDKLIVAVDPDGDVPLALELSYRLARARVLMATASGDGVDAGAVHDTVERALAAMDEVRRIKGQLSGAETSIEKARAIVDEMAARVRGHLQEIDELVRKPGDDGQAELDV